MTPPSKDHGSSSTARRSRGDEEQGGVSDLCGSQNDTFNIPLPKKATIERLKKWRIIELLLSKPGIKVHARNNEGDGSLDICPPIRARMTIIQRLKARKRANPPSPTDMQMMLLTVAGLVLTITFQALLSPPGGLWQDSGRGNPGKAILRETNPVLYTFVMAFIALGFSASLVLILIKMIMRIEKLFSVNSLVVVALVSIKVAFILILITIS